MMFCYGCRHAEPVDDDTNWCSAMHCKKLDKCVPAFHPTVDCKDFEEERENGKNAGSQYRNN